MVKRSYSVAFKKEVVSYIEEGHSVYDACKHFSARDHYEYDPSMFYQWNRNKDKVMEGGSTSKRVPGAGRKPALGTLEEMLASEIVELRLMKTKVSRGFIAERAQQLALENNVALKVSNTWISSFMRRFHFSLRRMTNLTTLSDDQLVLRAVEYMKYLRGRLPSLQLQKTLLMDETAIYFEDCRTRTVDFAGRRHVVMKSTGFASMRITAAMAVWADGRKAAPLVIHKGRKSPNIERENGPLLYTYQERAWVDQQLIATWIDALFPLIDTASGKAIIWDSCRSHIAKSVKEHCRLRNIELIVIPGGLTPYLQAGDIGIFKNLKDNIGKFIHEWKHSEHVQYTRGGQPKPPEDKVVRSWVRDAWRMVPNSAIENSISAAGFASDHMAWHIAKHDVYGERFLTAWVNSGDIEVSPDELEAIPQDDDLFEGIDS